MRNKYWDFGLFAGDEFVDLCYWKKENCTCNSNLLLLAPTP